MEGLWNSAENQLKRISLTKKIANLREPWRVFGAGNRKETMQQRTILAGAILLIGGVAFSAAEAANSIGSFKQWNAYTSSEKDGKMCFAASQPTDSKYQPNAKVSRDPVFFMVTIIPAKKIKNEASTIIGYAFKPDSKVTVDIDGTKFTMFTDKDSAWIENPAQESKLIDTLRKGKKMTIQGTSKRGTVTTDSYSLSGAKAALDAIAKECPVAAGT